MVEHKCPHAFAPLSLSLYHDLDGDLISCIPLAADVMSEDAAPFPQPQGIVSSKIVWSSDEAGARTEDFSTFSRRPFLISRIPFADVVMSEDSGQFFHGCVMVKWVPILCLFTLSFSHRQSSFDHFQACSTWIGFLCLYLFLLVFPLVFSLVLCLFMAVSSVTSTSFSLGEAALCWDLLHELQHPSLFLVVPSFCCTMCLRSWLGSRGFFCPEFC